MTKSNLKGTSTTTQSPEAKTHLSCRQPPLDRGPAIKDAGPTASEQRFPREPRQDNNKFISGHFDGGMDPPIRSGGSMESCDRKGRKDRIDWHAFQSKEFGRKGQLERSGNGWVQFVYQRGKIKMEGN